MEKTLMLEKIEGRRRKGQQRMRCLDGTTNSVDMNLRNWEIVKVRLSVGGWESGPVSCSAVAEFMSPVMH